MGQFCHLELKVHNSKDSNGDLKDCISKEESNSAVDYLSTCLELPYSQPDQGPWKLSRPEGHDDLEADDLEEGECGWSPSDLPRTERFPSTQDFQC